MNIDYEAIEQIWLKPKNKEIERLNNIINELERHVKDNIDDVKYSVYDDVLDKLQELKENK